MVQNAPNTYPLARVGLSHCRWRLRIKPVWRGGWDWQSGIGGEKEWLANYDGGSVGGMAAAV
jgi:hypothetical protein